MENAASRDDTDTRPTDPHPRNERSWPGACPPIVLRFRYAMSGTEIGLVAPRLVAQEPSIPVMAAMCLRACYAVSSTETALTDATTILLSARALLDGAGCQRICCAACGPAYGVGRMVLLNLQALRARAQRYRVLTAHLVQNTASASACELLVYGYCNTPMPRSARYRTPGVLLQLIYLPTLYLRNAKHWGATAPLCVYACAGTTPRSVWRCQTVTKFMTCNSELIRAMQDHSFQNGIRFAGHAIPGTDTTTTTVASAYALATACPVLTQRSVLPDIKTVVQLCPHIAAYVFPMVRSPICLHRCYGCPVLKNRMLLSVPERPAGLGTWSAPICPCDIQYCAISSTDMS
eukprot:819987-Rhodomonas_salina.3